MADLRVIALVALAAGSACGDAGAEAPTASRSSAPLASGIKPPAGWQELPQLAVAAKDALGKTEIDGVEAWGEPAMGCYGVWMATRGAGSATAVADRILAGLVGGAPGDAGAGAPRLDVGDVVKPTAEQGVLSLRFERGPYRGRFRARLGDGRIVALACFANQREPLACDAACTTLLGGLP